MSDATNRVIVSTLVQLDPEACFEVFTAKIDGWWRRDHRYRESPGGWIGFEEDGDGRALIIREERDGPVHELGRVRIWEPGKHLVFEWKPQNFEPDQTTEVEVRFEPDGDATRVTLTHSGFDALPADHPVRHGLEGGDFVSMMGVWWADLLVAHRRLAEQ